MKRRFAIVSATVFIALVIVSFTYPVEKLLAPEKLSAIIKDSNAPKPFIVNVGPTPLIKGANYIGAAEDPANKERLKALVKDLQKNKDIVFIADAANWKIAGIFTKQIKSWLPWDLPIIKS
jgi:hypothetical protein